MKNSPRFTPQESIETIKRNMLFGPPYTVVDFEKSRGSFLFDAVSEREYLDFYSFFASLPLGFNHPGMRDPDFVEDIKRTGLCKPANSEIFSIEMAEFVDTFRQNAAPENFDYFFFISGGALAVENALKAAFDWKVRKNLARGIKNRGTQIIHFKKAFHGRTGYTLSMTNTFEPNKTKYFPVFNWPRVTSPILRFPLNSENLDEVKRLENIAVKEIKQALTDHPDDIAALIIEPIQGEGGDNHLRPEFFQELRGLADENEFLLIFDEVQCGMGITGKMWCAQHFDVMPDIFCFGKKAQVAGIMSNHRVDDVDNVFKVAGRINSTFGGNLVDMVRCRRYLEIIKQENLVQNAARVGQRLLDGLIKLADSYEILTNVRGRGLMIAFDLPSSKDRNDFINHLFESGCLVLPCGERSIRLRPALNLRVEDADKGLGMFADGLSKIYGGRISKKSEAAELR